MVRVGKDWRAWAVIWAVLLGVVCPSALGQEGKPVIRPQVVKLVVCPQKVSAEAGKYSLLPPEASLTDGDAVPLYGRAIKTLPADTDLDQIIKWLAMPLGQLPLREVQRVLEQHKESLDGATQAARCRECKWPKLTVGEAMADLSEYRRLGFVIRLWTRCEVAHGNYEAAIRAMQTGFAMGKHLTQAPALVQFLVGVSIARMMCGEVEVFVQADAAPSLHTALAALPKPFADVEKAIQNDEGVPSRLARLLSKQVDGEMKASQDRVRLLAKRLDRDLAALQCIEAVRLYTASHSGQLPQTLAEITESAVPKDPMSGEAFRYTLTGATATLESTAPAGGEKKDELRYEITVKN